MHYFILYLGLFQYFSHLQSDWSETCLNSVWGRAGCYRCTEGPRCAWGSVGGGNSWKPLSCISNILLLLCSISPVFSQRHILFCLCHAPFFKKKLFDFFSPVIQCSMPYHYMELRGREGGLARLPSAELPLTQATSLQLKNKTIRNVFKCSPLPKNLPCQTADPWGCECMLPFTWEGKLSKPYSGQRLFWS